jgi:hypothetical protein
MAAGLGFKDFVTGEVLTAADVDGYLMQNIWVFASAAARDSAVTSPQEGNFAYLKDTNVTTYYTGSAWANLDTTGMTNPMTTTGDTIYSSSGSTPARLGIGSTGQVLTVAAGVPSWATPGGGAGITLIDELAFSASQTINVNDVFSSTYKNYKVFITGTSTSSNPLTMRLRLSGTDTSTDYTNQSLIVDATSTTARRNYTGNDDWQLGDINADAATFEISIFNPNIADKTGYSCTNGLLLSSINNLTESFTGFQTAGTQFTGFTLLSASNATGTVLVYGFAKE